MTLLTLLSTQILLESSDEESRKAQEDEMETAISKTQKRAARLLNLQAGDTYESAKNALEAAGYRGDAIPSGKTWRDAAKMTDEQYLSALKFDGMLPTAEELADSKIEW